MSTPFPNPSGIARRPQRRRRDIFVEPAADRFPSSVGAAYSAPDGAGVVGGFAFLQRCHTYGAPAPQRRLVAALDAEAAQMDSVRALLPRFEAKIHRVLDRVWGNGGAA
ncbi:MAG: hypothetical protein HY043_00520 [Verrucomicrobia bacterium]|nr:hypothetical protein [Verrucomicrobiota bacterium]